MRGRRPRPERAAVDVDDGGQRLLARTGRRGDPHVDRATRRRAPGRGASRASRRRPASASRSVERVVQAGVAVRRRSSAPSRACPASRARRSARLAPRRSCGSRPHRRPRARSRATRRSAGSIEKTYGCERPRSEIVATIRRLVEPERAVPAVHEPAGEVGVDPVADRPVEVRGEMLRRPRAVGRSEDDAGLMSSSGSGSRMPIAAIQRPSGRPAGWFAQPPGARTSRGSACVAVVDVDRPDRRSRVEVGLGAAIAREGDRPAVGVPRDVRDAPVAARDLARSAARQVRSTNRCDQRSRCPSSSQRQSVRVMRRAIGLVVLRRLAAPRDRCGLARR